jgi:hypothetical protein
VVASIVHPSGVESHLNTPDKNEGSFEESAGSAGEHKLCFRGTDSKTKVISFSFERENETIDEDEAAQKSNVDTFDTVLRDISRHMDMVQRNI